MAARVPDIAAGRNLRLFDAHYIIVADVEMFSDGMGIEEAIEVAALTGAPFISLEVGSFDTKALLENLEFSDDAPRGEILSGLINKAQQHGGDCDQLWVRWAANGLNYEWTALAEWRRVLAVQIMNAKLKAEQESSVRADANRAQSDALVAFLLDSPEFRTALPTMRYPTGLAVFAGSEHSGASESIIQQAASRASTEVDRRVLALEISLKPHMEQLAEELRKTTIWRASTSIPKRHAAAIDFLIGKAEGYRLSSRITDPLMRAAKELDEGNIVFMPVK
jgi:hypothetical protein